MHTTNSCFENYFSKTNLRYSPNLIQSRRIEYFENNSSMIFEDVRKLFCNNLQRVSHIVKDNDKIPFRRKVIKIMWGQTNLNEIKDRLNNTI